MYPYSIDQYIEMISKKDAKITQLQADYDKLLGCYELLLEHYVQSMQNKCPANLLTAGHKEWMEKIK